MSDLYTPWWKDDGYIPWYSYLECNALCFMPAMDSLELANLVLETRQHLKLVQIKFFTELGGLFRHINAWKNGRTMRLFFAFKQMKDGISDGRGWQRFVCQMPLRVRMELL